MQEPTSGLGIGRASMPVADALPLGHERSHAAGDDCPLEDDRYRTSAARPVRLALTTASISAWSRGQDLNGRVASIPRARADHMAIVKPPRLGLDHVADAAPRPHGWSISPHRAVNRRGECSALAGQFAQYAANGVPGARTHLTAARTKERFFASQVTAGGPIVAPWNTPTVPILQQPDPRKLGKCSEFLDSGEWAIQDSNLGPLPYQENLLSPPVVPTRT